MEALTNSAGTVGIVIVAVVLILRELPPAIKALGGRVNGNGKNGAAYERRKSDERIGKMAEQIEQMHTMHNVLDEDGTPIWYVPRSLERSLRELTAVTRELVVEMRITRNAER